MPTNFEIDQPNTVDSLAADFAACGLRTGQTVLVHSAMSKIGWIVGGEVAVIQALLRVLGAEGTLMMPTHTGDNSDPSDWSRPPVPEAWWQTIRDQMPAFDPATSPTYKMGRIAELFRTFPGVQRSNHPNASFAALGQHAHFLTAEHPLTCVLGEQSPLGKLYQLDGHVLLLGVEHGNNTSLHLAESRAQWASKKTELIGSAMLVDGQRQWVEYEDLAYEDEDFARLGADFDAVTNLTIGRVGLAEARLMRQRPLVDYAVTWIERNRT